MKKIICCLATLVVAFGALSAVTFVKANAETTPSFKGVSVSLNKDIVLKFEVENYTDGYTLTFNYKNKDYVGEVKDGGVVEFAYVTPQYLGEPVTATIYDGENKVAETKKSVKDYLYELVRAKKSDETYEAMPCEQFAAMKTLAVDMLNYGAAAQTKYLEATDEELVTAELTTEEAALATKFVAPDKSAQATLSGEKAGYEWVSAGIRFDYNVSLYFVIKPLTENAVLKLKVGDNEVIDKFIVDEDGNYKFRYENVNVVDFANKYTVTVWDGETQIGQTLSYSVNTYVLNMHANAEMGALTQAVYNYGVSADKYNKATTAHLYDSLSFDGEAIAYVGEDFDLTTYTLNKVCSVCGHEEAVDWNDIEYTAPDTTAKGEKKVALTVGDLSTEITVKVYEKIVTPTNDILKGVGSSGWTVEFDRQVLSADGYSTTKGYLPNEFVERIEYILFKDEKTELGKIYLTKSGANGYLSDTYNIYSVDVRTIGDMYATNNPGISGSALIKQKWSNLSWLAMGDNFKTGETYKIKAKVVAKAGTYYADSETFVTNQSFTAIEPDLILNATNLQTAKQITETPTDIEKDLSGSELTGAVLLKKGLSGSSLQISKQGNYYAVSNIGNNDKITLYVYSTIEGKIDLKVNVSSADAYRIDGTEGRPDAVREVELKGNYTFNLNGEALTLADEAKAPAYSQKGTYDWSVCSANFKIVRLATVTIKKGWNVLEITHGSGGAINLGDISFAYVA